MPKKGKPKKKATEFCLDCPCGEKAQVFETARGYMAHCVDCGAICFFDNEKLLERLRFGGRLCPHKLEPKTCRGGRTTWCPACRIRTFYYDERSMVQE